MYNYVNLNDESMPTGNTVLRKVRTELLLITIMQTWIMNRSPLIRR